MGADDKINLGQIIKETGDFGRFQALAFAAFTGSLVVLTWSMMNMAFTAAVPNYTCIVHAIGQNTTGNWTEANVCSINGTACDKIVFEDDMSTAVSEWGLVCDKKWVSQTLTTVQMSGLLVGGLLWGHVSDTIGRKPTFFLNIFLLGACNAISYFSVSWQMFAVMRFVIGFACTGFMSAPLLFEFIRNKWRVFLYLVPGWAFWASMMAGFCWLVPDWRYIHVFIAAASVPSLLLWFFIPESFRWLVSNGRVDEAEKSIQFVARVNGKPKPDLERLRVMIEKEQEEAKATKTLQIYTILDLFRTRKLRKTTILFALIWLFSSYSYYGIAFGVQELSGNLYLNLFLITIVDIPGNILLVLFNTWGGRRWTCVGFYMVGGCLALTVGILQYTDASVSGTVFDTVALLSKLCVSAAWEINTLWSQESFPTVVRFIAGGFISSVSRIGSMVAPQIITLSMDTPGLLYFVSGVVCVVSSVMSIFLDETKNKDLSDMLPPKKGVQPTPEPVMYTEKIN